ncbi:PREDICTED: ephrin type-B receptor 5-like, partial [Buceros rhinoceros silvestris]|uniref:ephrin type-B receptor 5-like n=1 Tax=Buceros rhinoceros silvestris TaxID=175836 RepID=UPI0005287E1D
MQIVEEGTERANGNNKVKTVGRVQMSSRSPLCYCVCHMQRIAVSHSSLVCLQEDRVALWKHSLYRSVPPRTLVLAAREGLCIGSPRVPTEILLDTTGETSEIGWTAHPSDGWDEVSVLDDRKSQIRTFQVCNVAEPGQNNWLRTHFIERRGAHRVHVRLRFSVRDCASMRTVASSCKETFTLYYHQSEADIATQELPEWREGPWTKVDTIAADESFSQVDSTGKVVKINVKVRSFGPLTKRGFYLAFQDSGACMSLVAVQVFFYKCPAVVKGFASFPETFAGGERTSLVESPGTCVPNAEETSMTGSSGVRLHCNGEGEWMVAIGRCTCKAGYQPADDERACE